MPEEDFVYLTKKIRPFTDYIYFHLMGEPLLHPQIEKFLAIANELGFKTTIATNAVLIKEKSDALLKNPPYKVTFSLHSYEANSMSISLNEYINNIINFCNRAEKKGTICVLRLWNNGGKNELNDEITDILKKKYIFSENKKGFVLSDKIYLEYADLFTWPDLNATEQNVNFCMGLKDHFGVLCDGSVVPCCLDSEGVITLGNLFEDSVENILSSSRAENMRKGFSERRCTEELCKKCQYATRFTK